ncbi:hypothetical protein ACI2L1_33170 [Streptomyces sp. NPDC019531]
MTAGSKAANLAHAARAGLSVLPNEAEQPPLPVVAVSRLVDAPRRMASWF